MPERETTSKTSAVAVIVAIVAALLMILGFIFRWPWG